MPTCLNCGASYADKSKFCPHCGTPKPQAPTLRVEVADALAPNTCPQCRRIDSVQKLSSIYASGTQKTEGSSYTSGSSAIGGSSTYYDSSHHRVGSGNVSGTAFSTSYTSMSAIAQSELAKCIAPPVEPTEPAKPGNHAGSVAAVSVAGAILGPVLFWAMTWDAPAYDYTLALVCGRPLVAAIVGGIIGGVFAAFALKPTIASEKAEYTQRVSDYEATLVDWNSALAIWNQLYYCHRDDVVFLPGFGQTAQPSDTARFCYRLRKHP